ncbi:hypothetical protein HPP92_003410 [Vanilla planifolia]|uniref:Uncharacterized protein n=1 Tax=Vanilla planifolia TaxID=51239 RepID=A0A835RZX0_VANPL|nr:hypothetical protein HPP92_003410 [Vanilla planifolia]
MEVLVKENGDFKPSCCSDISEKQNSTLLDDEEVPADCSTADELPGSTKKKKKRNKSKKKKEQLEQPDLPSAQALQQTDPPSIPVDELIPSGEYPIGEIQEYKMITYGGQLLKKRGH